MRKWKITSKTVRIWLSYKACLAVRKTRTKSLLRRLKNSTIKCLILVRQDLKHTLSRTLKCLRVAHCSITVETIRPLRLSGTALKWTKLILYSVKWWKNGKNREMISNSRLSSFRKTQQRNSTLLTSRVLSSSQRKMVLAVPSVSPVDWLKPSWDQKWLSANKHRKVLMS